MSAQNNNKIKMYSPANDNSGSNNAAPVFSSPKDLQQKVAYRHDGLTDVRMRMADLYVKYHHRPDFIDENKKSLKKLLAVTNKLQKVQNKKNCVIDVLDELFFIAHQIRGQGGSFGFSAITDVAEILCLLIDQHKSGQRKAFGAIQKTIHVLEELLTNTIVR